MQLIVDAPATVDIEKNMSTIKQEPLNEKFSTNIIENFTNDEIRTVEEVNDDIKGCIANSKESLENENIEEKDIELPEIISDGRDNPENVEVKESPLKDYAEVTDSNNSLLSIEEEVKEDGNKLNNDIETNKEQPLESNIRDTNVQEDVESEHNNLFDDTAVEISSNLNETTELVKDNVNIIDENTNVVENTNERNSEKKCKDIAEIDVGEKMCKFNIEEQNVENADNVVISDAQNQNEEILIPGDSNDEDDVANSECNINSQSISAASQNNTESVNKDDCNKNSVIEIDQMDDVIETESDNIENNTEKIVDEDEKEDTKKDNEDDIETEASVAEIAKNLESEKVVEKKKIPLICKLTNTLDILSDDEDEQKAKIANIDIDRTNGEKQCINLVDDDDIMLVDEHDETSVNNDIASDTQADQKSLDECDTNEDDKLYDNIQTVDPKIETDSDTTADSVDNDKSNSETSGTSENVTIKPLLPSNFLKTCKKNLAEMTREDLEEFCILKIVESVVDRSSLGDIKTQLKNMASSVEEYKKKALMLTKQNRDLQVVLKSVQEEQKKGSVHAVTPLKISRSVGIQVFMADKPNAKRKNAQILLNSSNHQSSPLEKSNRSTNNQKVQKNNNQQIPFPRLVPAANTSSNKANATTQVTTGKSSQSNNLTSINGVKNTSPSQKPEKRMRVQSVTVDLTDDEPPTKVATRCSPVPPVRLVSAQNLLVSQRPQFPTNINSPRKVYIPISGPQAQTIRPGQTVMLKSVASNPGPKQRGNNSLGKMQSIRPNRIHGKHPAPLPDVMKQYQPPNWKALPPAPDLKLSKVDNGIVISWKIEGYEEDSYEEITSYQLYAYQETPSPPSTALWKKIGDVKALPLPMACTLTQFMTGYKYYFAVRAIDIKSRFGPFSLPGSILLLNKM